MADTPSFDIEMTALFAADDDLYADFKGYLENSRLLVDELRAAADRSLISRFRVSGPVFVVTAALTGLSAFHSTHTLIVLLLVSTLVGSGMVLGAQLRDHLGGAARYLESREAELASLEEEFVLMDQLRSEARPPMVLAAA
jgi:hypothetical protein